MGYGSRLRAGVHGRADRLAKFSQAALVAAFLLAASATPARAQRITGRVTAGDTVTAAAGAIIEARRAGSLSGHRVSASSSGNFVLILPDSGRYELTVLRVGHRPTRLGVRTVARGEVLRERIVLLPSPIALSALRVETERVCGPRAVAGAYVATLIDQARAVVASSTAREADAAVEARWTEFWVVTDRQRTPLTPVRMQRKSGASQSAFASVGADRLAREGYVVRDDAGDEYRAPDADVLLSDDFIASNCFEIVESPGAMAGAIGVRFSPIGGGTAERVRIAGTLWFDRETATLRRLEFGYAGIAPEIEAAGAGGTIDFTRLAGGSWSVRQWELRMPRRINRTLEGGPVVQEVVEVFAVTRVGGWLEEVRIGDRVAFAAASAEPDLLADVTVRAKARASCDAAPVPASERRGIIYGMVYDADSVPVRMGSVLAKWRVGNARRDLSGTITVPVRDGFYQVCGLPFGTLVVLTASAEWSGERTLNLRVTERQSGAPLHILLPPPKQ